MMAERFKRLKLSKIWPWISLTVLLIAALFGGMTGEVWMLVAILILVNSMFAGVAIGGRVARILNRKLFKLGISYESRLVQSFQVFGFLSFPTVFSWFANAFFEAGIEMHALGQHIFWNCILSAGAFLLKPDESEKPN